MSVTLTVNGVSYLYPETENEDWGDDATDWARAVTQGMLQKAGGLFSLTSELDFGAAFGIKSLYYKTRSASIAAAGQIRLARTDLISFRNNGDSGDLSLGVSASDVLQFNGEDVIAGAIVNADISASAAIALSKLAALTASRALVSNGSGVITVASALASEVDFLSGVTSAIQTQINSKLATAGGTMTGQLFLAADPVSSLEAATKSYVDNLVTGLQVKSPCRVATTANLSIATDLENGDTVDGVTLSTGDRVLVKNQSTPAQNGIYVVPVSGAASRATDMDTWAETLQAYIFVSAGTINASTGWVSQSTAGGTIGVTSLTFAQFSASTQYSADNQGVLLTGNQFSLQLDGGTLSQTGSGVKVATGALTNTQINASAAIALTKLAALTASRVLVSDGSGFVSPSSVTSTTLGFLDASSSIQTQLDAKIAASVMTTNNDMIYRAAGVPARLAAGSDAQFLTSQSGVPTWSTINGDSYAIARGGNGYGSTNTKIRRFLSTFASSGSGITYADSATLGGTMTINEDGFYFVNVGDNSPAGSTLTFGISVNANGVGNTITSLTYANGGRGLTNAASGTNYATLSFMGRFNNGDVIRHHCDSNTGTGSANSTFLEVVQLFKIP